MDTKGRESDILGHYIRLWGQPQGFRNFTYDSPTLPDNVRVYKFRLQEQAEDWAFATVGMSRKSLSHPSGVSDMRIELFLLCYGEQDQIADNLSTIAAYPFHQETFFAHGHTIHGSPGHGIVDGSPLTDLVLTRADFGQTPDFVEHHDRSHTHLFWIIPIYPAEREFAATQGWPALRRLFQAEATDVLDLSRPSMV